MSIVRTVSNAYPDKIVLRDYQQTAVHNVLRAIEDGIKRPAVVLATGGGKTIVMASLIPKLKFEGSKRRKVLVLAHKEELVRQAHATISRVNPHLNVQIDMQKSVPTPEADVIVGSVMTLVRMTRLELYDPLEFRAIVLDECHHAVATSWTKILNYFGALDDDPEILILGFTATLERSDGKGLGSIFEDIVFERSLKTMVEKKELCDVKFSTIKVSLELEKVRKSMGDYATSLLSKVVNVDVVNLQVARAYVQLRKQFGFRSTLIFCVDIEHCKTLCGVLQANGVNAQYVTGETVKYERQAILDDFKNGDIDVLCNVLVFTEGTDIPNIDSLILARPTRSRPLLVQMIGRGLRLHQGKLYCHVSDIVDTAGVGVLSVPTLFGLSEEFDIQGKSFLELEKELEEIKEQKSERARLREINALLEIQQKMKDLDLEIDTIDGFAELEKASEMSALSIRSTNKTFKECGMNWVRLEYNLWGLPVPFAEYFYSIERVVDEEDNTEDFKLCKLTYTPKNVLFASNFRAKRISDLPITSGSLKHVISVASNNMLRHHNWNSSKEDMSRKIITAKQSGWIILKLSHKIEREHGIDALNTITTEIKKMKRWRASDLIFALKYSINSLFVRWEIRRLLDGKLTSRKQKQKI